jgi:hypothetical protein
VGEIERFIRTVKERIRATYNSLPFERLPTRLVTEMVNSAVFWWNSFPGNSAISDCLSPSEIVLRRGLDYQKHCQLEFGEYVQTHEATDNTMAPRTVGALALRPSGNAQGGHLFYSLSTGKVLHRNHWTALPMPQEVIDRVTVLASAAPTGLTFIDRLQEIVGDDPLVLEYFAGGGHGDLEAESVHEPQDEQNDNEGIELEIDDFGDGNHDSDLTDDDNFGHDDNNPTPTEPKPRGAVRRRTSTQLVIQSQAWRSPPMRSRTHSRSLRVNSTSVTANAAVDTSYDRGAE